MELSKFLVAYRINDDYWWTLSLGDAQVLFDAAVERMEAAEARLEAVRQGGYKDSDLASLATTLRARVDAVERELEQARDYVDEALGDTNPSVPLVDRIVRLVSMLAASSTTMPGLDDAVDNHTVDALARRVEALEESATTLDVAITRLVERVEAIAQRVRAEAGTNSTAFRNIDAAWRKMDARIAALEQTVANLQRLAQQTHGPEAGL